jgi:hypothetical protein
MTPSDLFPPLAAISLGNSEPSPDEPLQQVVGQAETPDDELARLALFEVLARMLSAPGAEPSHDAQASDPTAAVIGMLLDANMTDSLLEPRSIIG